MEPAALFSLDPNPDNEHGSEGSDDPKELKRRFAKLPVHKACYGQFYQPNAEVALRKVRSAATTDAQQGPWTMFSGRQRRRSQRQPSGDERDRFGFTPLHILACSARHDPRLYRLLVETYPNSLIAKDVWGDVPLLYALWGNAPKAIVEYLAERTRTLFPDYRMDWRGMVETIGKARYVPGTGSAAAVCVRNGLILQRTYFSEDDVDWAEIATEWAAEDGTCETKGRDDGLGRLLHADTFRCLMRFGVLPSLKSLGVARWRQDVWRDVDSLPWFVQHRKKNAAAVFSKLARYERLDGLREAASLLELGLWKARINDCLDEQSGGADEAERRHACRIRSGAEVVVPNVLSFLVPGGDCLESAR